MDSIGSVRVTVAGGGEGTAHYWIVASDDFFRAKDHNDTIVDRTPESFIQRTSDYWSYWVTRDPTDLWPLEPSSRDLYRRSMLVVRTQIDDGGAIIAANDSDILQFGRDTYSYMWPRDGALVAEALIGANQRELAGRFFQFCRRALQPGGFMLHKYHPDGSPGSSWHPWADANRQRVLPIQEDETALVLWALRLYNQRFMDTEFIRGVYAPLIKASADFLVRYRHEPSGSAGGLVGPVGGAAGHSHVYGRLSLGGTRSGGGVCGGVRRAGHGFALSNGGVRDSGRDAGAPVQRGAPAVSCVGSRSTRTVR